MNQQSKNMGPLSLIIIASCDDAIYVRSTGVEAVLQVHGEILSKTSSELAIMRGIGTTSRIYMVLENMRGTFDAAVLRVYLRISAPDGGKPTSEVYLGSLGLFGLRNASLPNSEGTNGMQCYLDITPQVAHFKGAALSIDTQLQVSIRPRNKLPDGVEISIERMRIYVETIKNLPTKA